MAIIEKKSMRDQCYSVIKEKILRQEFGLGEFINISELSAELSVSNTPIREALSLLESDGLVISAPNTRAQVIEFTKVSTKEIFQTFHILAKGAYELCIKENRKDQLCRLLAKSLAEQELHLAGKDYYQFTHATVGFDRAMFEALNNTQLLAVFDNLLNIMFLLYRTNHQKNDLERSRSISDHRRILDAIISGNHARVEQLQDEHYNSKW